MSIRGTAMGYEEKNQSRKYDVCQDGWGRFLISVPLFEAGPPCLVRSITSLALWGGKKSVCFCEFSIRARKGDWEEEEDVR